MHYFDWPCRITYGDAVFRNIPHDNRADADNRMASDGLSLQDLHTRAEFAAFADVDAARDVRARIDCHKVF